MTAMWMWVLIVVLKSGEVRTASIVTGFETRDACEEAGAEILDELIEVTHTTAHFKCTALKKR